MRLALLAFFAATAPLAPQGVDDPAIRAVVERFYATQEAEDAAAYLALWSKAVQRPTSDQLKYIFDGGDDRFSDLTILRVTPIRDGLVVRVSVTRDRTSATLRRPDGSPMTSRSVTTASLFYVREDGGLKLTREGSPGDGLAAMLIESATSAEREELMAAEPDLVGLGLVRSIARQADAFAQRQQYAQAQRVYERALEVARRIPDSRLEAEMLQNIGNAMYFQRDFAGALDTFERRLTLERAGQDDEGIASALLSVATVHYARFEYTTALATYREALAIQERLDDRPGLATTLISTGNVQYIQGDYPGAIADYRRSRDLYRMVPNTTGEARALEGLGRSFAAQGDFAAALESYAGVLDEGRARSDRALQGNALQSIGEIHFRLGNLETARPLFDRSREQFEALKDLPNVGRVWQAAALTDLVAARFAAAEQEYGASGAACAAAQDNECAARAIVGLAFAQFSQDHFSAAVLSYRKAIAAFTALQRREDAARAEVGLSQTLLGLKDHAPALAAAGRARDTARAAGYDDVLWRALVAEARALRRMGSAVKAMAAATDAVATIARMADAALERPGDAVPSDSGAAYAMLAVLQAEAGDAAAALATVEQARGHVLRVALARNERDIARGMTTAERAAERAAAADVASLRIQIEREAALPKPDAARVRGLRESLALPAATRATLRQQLFERLPGLRTWRGLAAPAGADEVVSMLPDAGTVIAELVIDEEDLLVITVRRTDQVVGDAGPGSGLLHARVVHTSRQALAERVARVVDPAVLQSAAKWRTASADLVALFPPDAWSELAAAPRAIIVPDGVLWRVPFEALPAGAGALGDATAILYAGSITSLLRAPAAIGPPAAVPLLAVGAPELPAAVRDRVAATSPGWALRAPDAADAEIRTVTAPFAEQPAVILSGAAATESAIRAQAPGAAVLHLAVPFRMNGASPLFSPLLLSAGQGAAELTAENDAVLEAREVMNLDLRARVAVLSDGAAASMRDAAPAAEIVRWAWRAAGVPSIVMARWATDDQAAAMMLAEFHTRVQAGETLEAALQGARAKVRAGEGTGAPYFWAGWMLVGR